MLYKEIACPACNGHGFICGGDDHSIWSKTCDNCNGIGFVFARKTNGDMIRTCNNEQLMEVYCHLGDYAIYSGGENNRLLDSTPSDFLLWLNKEVDDVDLRTIFDFINKEDCEHPHTKAIKKIT